MTAEATGLPAALLDATGYDPTEEPAFAWSQSEPCGRCGTITATAIVSFDGETSKRLCLDCFDQDD